MGYGSEMAHWLLANISQISAALSILGAGWMFAEGRGSLKTSVAAHAADLKEIKDMLHSVDRSVAVHTIEISNLEIQIKDLHERRLPGA
jgi:hypothetical protein